MKHLAVVLHSLGHQYAFITRSKFLFERLREEMFDLILLDINMPSIDGVTILEQLQHHPELQKIPVIMLTGEAKESLVMQCFELGAKDYINKTARELILKARIENVLAVQNATLAMDYQTKRRNRELEVACDRLKQLNHSFMKNFPQTPLKSNSKKNETKEDR